MKTEFTEAQLADPDVRVAAQQLRNCVHCGFCLAACPTYALVGSELDSPRGRIVLMQDLLERGEATPAVIHHVDRCLSCLACQTACPSGVHYMHLVDHARATIESQAVRPWPERLQRALLGWLLPYPARFRWALALAPLGRLMAPWLPSFLQPMIDLAPAKAVRRWIPPPAPAPDPQKPRIALLVGCVQSVLDADVHDATVRVLERLGAQVVVIDGLGCCGAVPHHLGQHDAMLGFVRQNVEALRPHLRTLHAIVSTVSGCGTMLEDYGHLLRNDPLAAEAARVSELSCDVLEAVETLGWPDDAKAPEPRRVAYHAACSLQHGQGVREVPKALLRRIGHTVLEPVDPHLCCGSAGTYNLLQPALATSLGTQKAAALAATDPEVIAAGNIGCAIQIGRHTDRPVRHPIQLLDEALPAPTP
ncbi:MAG: glycolate oxidase subunit GlcF [Myxococcota bacterium]